MVTIAEEYPWEKGDRIVLIKGEFPTNVVPWLNAAKRNDVAVDWVELEDVLEESPAFKAAVTAKTRLLAVSWVQFQTGKITPLAHLSHLRAKYNLHICVDAIQGLGPLRMNLAETPLDFVVTGGHKWLMSPAQVVTKILPAFSTPGGKASSASYSTTVSSGKTETRLP